MAQRLITVRLKRISKMTNSGTVSLRDGQQGEADMAIDYLKKILHGENGRKIKK